MRVNPLLNQLDQEVDKGLSNERVEEPFMHLCLLAGFQKEPGAGRPLELQVRLVFQVTRLEDVEVGDVVVSHAFLVQKLLVVELAADLSH